MGRKVCAGNLKHPALPCPGQGSTDVWQSRPFLHPSAELADCISEAPFLRRGSLGRQRTLVRGESHSYPCNQAVCLGVQAPCKPVPLGHHVARKAQPRDAHKSLPFSGPQSFHLSNGYNHPHLTQLIKVNRTESALEIKIQ